MNTVHPSDSDILNMAEDFKSQYQHGGTIFDEFDSLGFARAVLALQSLPVAAPADGFTQVPVEPSPIAIERICAASADEDWPEGYGKSAQAIRRRNARLAYAEMLAAAAPTPAAATTDGAAEVAKLSKLEVMAMLPDTRAMQVVRSCLDHAADFGLTQAEMLDAMRIVAPAAVAPLAAIQLLRDLTQHASEGSDHPPESFSNGVTRLANRAHVLLASAQGDAAKPVTEAELANALAEAQGKVFGAVPQLAYVISKLGLRRAAPQPAAPVAAGTGEAAGHPDVERLDLLGKSDWYVGPQYDTNEAGGVVGYDDKNGGPNDLRAAIDAYFGTSQEGGA